MKLGYVLGAAAAVAGATAWLIAPGRADAKKKAPFLGANIAHRGLHTQDRRVPENSLPAFSAAVEAGYGVEFDVHLTADEQLAVFHDDTLERMCGVSGRTDEQSYARLAELDLAGTGEKIPLLAEVLDTVRGRTPIILELKRGSRNTRLCELVYAALRDYGGAICIESFDPMIVRWWRKNAPEYLRGQLSAPAPAFHGELGGAAAFALSRLLTNFLCRPQFIAYGIRGGKKPLTVRLCEGLGAMPVAWTSHDPSAEAGNDTVIFEFYRPKQRFK